MRLTRFATLPPAVFAVATLLIPAVDPPPAVAEKHAQASKKTAVVCLDGIKGRSTRLGFAGCFEPSALELRQARDERGAPATTVAMTVALDQVEAFRARVGSGAASEGRICIINGANICFEEPLEIVWVCITTGQLAGYECPEVEGDSGAAVVGLASPSGR